MSKVFSKPVNSWISSDNSLKIAEIVISKTGESSTVSNLPIVEINSLSHTIRQQIASTLSGDLYVLTTKGGLGGCTVTFLDRVNVDCKDSSGKSSVIAESAITKYDDIRKNPEAYTIDIKILAADSSTPLSSFHGVASSCSVQLATKNDVAVAVAYVTFELVGIWK